MEESTEDRHQAIISLAYDDWEDLIEQLDIDRAMVNHDIDALREKRKSKKAKYSKMEWLINFKLHFLPPTFQG